ncbi:MAG: hypothetical protein IT349_04240 [Candidatus Eisenbacteria bacterium]|nr:hypothetical protein [Candidatus Eisenbacteria bacterium]
MRHRRAILLLLACAGCGLEAPKAPRYETDLYVPLGRERASGIDLLRGSDYFSGDSTGVEPLRFRLDGTIDPFTVDELLDLDVPTTRIQSGLDDLTFDAPAPRSASFTLEDLSALDLPGNGAPVVVPAFIIDDAVQVLDPEAAFDWVRFRAGEVRVRLGNRLPVPIGGTGARALGVRVRNLSSGAIAADLRADQELAPGDDWSGVLPLSGIELERQVRLEVYGGSAGSGGVPVRIENSAGLDVGLSYGGVAADSIRAALPEQEISLDGSIRLSSDSGIRVRSGRIESGVIGFSLRNPFPLPAELTLSLPELEREATSIEQTFSIAAARNGIPATFLGSIDLADVTWDLAQPTDRLSYRLRGTIAGSGGTVVALGLLQQAEFTTSPATLRCDDLEGTMTARGISIPSAETSIDPPEGIDRLDFAQAELSLEVENGVPLPARAALQIVGLDPRNGPEVTIGLDADIEAGGLDGPRTTRLVFDSATTDLLALIRSRPRRLRLGGELRVGDGSALVLIRRADRVGGNYALEAPLRARIGELTYESDPYRFSIADQAEEAIQDDVILATAEGTVENHFPMGLRAEFVFAEEESGLGNPAVRIGPVAVAAADTDAKGRVQASRFSPFTLAVSRDDVDFFARDEVFGRVAFFIEGDSSRLVDVTANDFVEVKALLRFRVRVEP